MSSGAMLMQATTPMHARLHRRRRPEVRRKAFRAMQARLIAHLPDGVRHPPEQTRLHRGLALAAGIHRIEEETATAFGARRGAWP